MEKPIKEIEEANHRLKLTARLFLAERPQLSRSVMFSSDVTAYKGIWNPDGDEKEKKAPRHKS